MSCTYTLDHQAGLATLICESFAFKVPAGSQFFYDTLGSADKALRVYEGHVHDLLNDLGKEAVIADIVAWIDRRLPTA